MPNEYNFPCYGAHLDAKPYLRPNDRVQLAMFMQDLLDVCIANYGEKPVIGVGGYADTREIEIIFRDHEDAEKFLSDWETVARRIRNTHAGDNNGVDPSDIPF